MSPSNKHYGFYLSLLFTHQSLSYEYIPYGFINMMSSNKDLLMLSVIELWEYLMARKFYSNKVLRFASRLKVN